MTELRTPSPRARWAVPAAAAVAVVAAFTAPPLLASAGQDGLPDRTPQELAERVAQAEPTPLSGTVVYTARLGLPDLGFTEMTGADPVALLGGSSTLRVWTDGVERSRVALLGSASEYSVVTDGPDTWTYSSSTEEVVHYSLDAEGRATYEALAEDARAGRTPAVVGDLPTPEQAARQALERAEEFAHVSLDAQTTVAGRSAYQLVVTPRSAETLVDRVVVAVDAETSAPLRVQAWSVQDPTTPALEIAFTDVTFAQPDEAVLGFSVPAGASVREVVMPLPEPPAEEARELALGGEGALPEGVSVIGTGWETVTVWTGVDVAALLAGDPAAVTTLPGSERLIGSTEAQDLIEEFLPGDGTSPHGFELDAAALYEQLSVEVPEGRLVSSALLSILVTDDGRVLVGAVPAETLRSMA
jgi:outer membrane lipoprotein-sorting protein